MFLWMEFAKAIDTHRRRSGHYFTHACVGHLGLHGWRRMGLDGRESLGGNLGNSQVYA